MKNLTTLAKKKLVIAASGVSSRATISACLKKRFRLARNFT